MSTQVYEHTFQTGLAQISYQTNREKLDQQAPTIVFLHGLSGNLRAWDQALEFFTKQKRQIVTVDLIGHGFSSRPGQIEDYHPVQMAKIIKKLITGLGLKKVIVVGHCFGGAVAWQVASRLPHGVLSALVLISSDPQFKIRFWYGIGKLFYHPLRWLTQGLFIFSPAKQRSSRFNYQGFEKSGDYNLLRIVIDLWHTSVHTYLAVLNNIFRQELLVDKISCPTLIIHGEKDAYFPAQKVNRLKKYFDNSEIVIFQNGNHVIPLNQAFQMAKIINQFLLKNKLT